MKKISESLQIIAVFLFVAIFTTVGLSQFVPKAKPLLQAVDKKKANNKSHSVYGVAIGDSLTEGIGDTTNSGGYVPLLEKEVKESYQLEKVEIDNFGKSGKRTAQIIEQIEQSEELQSKIAAADMVVMTIGANDLMKVVKTQMFSDLRAETFDKPKEAYKEDLSSLYKIIRTYNSKCPIYQLGIYNPFYLNFKEITEMQDIVDAWNDITKELIDSQNAIYFIPINEQLYQGDGIVASTSDTNNLLSDVDSFHPNNTGYQIIANAFRDEMKETEDVWLTN